MVSTTVDLCAALKVTLYQRLVKTVYPNLTCPMTGTDIQVNNLTYPLADAAYMPEGFYRYRLSLKDDLDDYIFAVLLYIFTVRILNTNDMQAFK